MTIHPSAMAPQDDGRQPVWSADGLDRLIADIPLGAEVRIQCFGTSRTAAGSVKTYEVVVLEEPADDLREKLAHWRKSGVPLYLPRSFKAAS